MQLTKGQLYVVKDNHKFHPRKIGEFHFLGGPEQDCAVLIDRNRSCDRTLAYFVVNPEDLEEIAR